MLQLVYGYMKQPCWIKRCDLASRMQYHRIQPLEMASSHMCGTLMTCHPCHFAAVIRIEIWPEDKIKRYSIKTEVSINSLKIPLEVQGIASNY